MCAIFSLYNIEWGIVSKNMFCHMENYVFFLTNSMVIWVYFISIFFIYFTFKLSKNIFINFIYLKFFFLVSVVNCHVAMLHNNFLFTYLLKVVLHLCEIQSMHLFLTKHCWIIHVLVQFYMYL